MVSWLFKPCSQAKRNSQCGVHAAHVLQMAEFRGNGFVQNGRQVVRHHNGIRPQPAALAAGEFSGTNTRLGCPSRAGLLVIIETKTCGSPVSSRLASTTSAGRCLKVARSLFRNHTSTTSPRSRPVIGFHPRRVPIFLPGGQFAAHLARFAER